MQTQQTVSRNTRIKEEVKELLEAYRGLRESDLHPINPKFSCVLCGYYTCIHHNKPQLCCFQQRIISEQEWLKFYDLFGQR